MGFYQKANARIWRCLSYLVQLSTPPPTSSGDVGTTPFVFSEALLPGGAGVGAGNMSRLDAVHPHTQSLSLSLSHTHTHSLSHTHTLSLSHTHTHSHRNTHTYARTHTLSLTHKHTLSLSHTQSHTHTYIHTLSRKLSCRVGWGWGQATCHAWTRYILDPERLTRNPKTQTLISKPQTLTLNPEP